jgi:hypothetical protein
MMSRKLPVLLLAASFNLLSAGPALAATTSSDVSKQATELWNSIKAYSSDKKQEAVAHGKKLLKDMDGEIGKLEAKASKAKGDTKVAYDKEVRDLKVARDKAYAKLDHWGKQSGAAWDEAKAGFADAYRDLHHAYDKAVAKIK